MGLINRIKLAVSWDSTLNTIQIGQQKSEIDSWVDLGTILLYDAACAQHMLRLSIYDVQHCPIGLRPIISQVYSACYPTSLTFHYAHACHTLVTNHSHCTTVVIKYSAIRSNQLSDVGNRLGVHQRRKFVTKASALGVKIPIFNVDNVVTKATTSEQARIRRWTGPCGGKWLYLCMVIRSCVLAVIVLSIFLSLAIKMPTNSCFGMYGTIIQNSCEGLACVTSIMLVFIFVQYSL